MTVAKKYKLTLNLNEAIEDFNPDLTEEQIEMIARDICLKWSYSDMYNQVEHKALEFMKYANFGYETEHESLDHEMHR
tara:strand:+ start:538 stop:771 length:234 start_codon:yes stop_codon:yes gene_type:complete